MSTRNLFDNPGRDLDTTARRIVRCEPCKGRGVRIKQTIHTKDGVAPVCGCCGGDGFIVIEPSGRHR